MRLSPSRFKNWRRLLTIVPLFAVSTVSAQLEEIIVSATKRAEKLQDVPVSVSAMSGETMEAIGITDMAELSAYMPNVEVVDTSILPNLYVRGIGSGTTHSIEQSVGRFIDEVYIGRAAINMHAMMDTAGVEMLRGPQGTLFGKNTLGGAMIIRTGDPTEEFEGRIKASASSYSTTGGVTGIDGYLSGPLGDNLRGRLAFLWKDKDGYIKNIGPGPDGGTRDDWGIRVKLAWDMGVNTTASLKLEHMEYEEDGQTSTVVPSRFDGNTSAANSAPIRNINPDFEFATDWVSHTDCETTVLDHVNGTPFCAGREQDSQNVTLQIDHDFEAGTLTSVSAFQSYFYDHDFAAVDQGAAGGGLRANRVEEFEGFTQEIRFTSEASDTFDYIAGVYFESSELMRDQLSHFNVADLFGFPWRTHPAIGGAFGSDNYNSALFFGPPHLTDSEDWVQDTQTIAVFGQFSYALTDQLELTLGGRWGTEDKDFEYDIGTAPLYGDPRAVTEENADPSPAGAQTTFERFDVSRSESKFTPSATLSYEPNDNVSFYATISEGHKTGGFSDRIQGDLEFDAETAISYELGMKGVWLDGTLETNLAIFRMEIEDLQVARQLPGGGADFEVKNAAEATSQGIELDGRWLLTDSLTMSFSAAYLDATYDDFPGANSGGCPVVGGTFELLAGTTSGEMSCNYAGLPLIFAPEYKGSISLDYFAENALSDWDLGARIGATYSDKYYVGINYREVGAQDSFSTVDASVRFISPDEKTTVSLVGRNLTEEFINSWGLQSGTYDWLSPRAPREIALQVAYSF